MIIAIDGPAGSGKSTLAKLLAKKMNFLFIDTGAMYRALTLKAIKKSVDLNDDNSLVGLFKRAKIDLKADNQKSILTVLLDGEDVSALIRDPDITDKVKFIARLKGVRAEMAKKQRELAKGSDVVLEGRDIGTVVFPDADKKFYLDASIHERAKRRQKDLIQAGHEVSLNKLKEEIKQRDITDIEREVAPLKKAEDAVYIDTTDMTIDEVCDTMLKDIKNEQ